MAQFVPKQFEEYAIHRMQRTADVFGWHVRRTPNSWDRGADIIIETSTGEIIAVVQCKHSSDPTGLTTGSEDIRQAIKNYRIKTEIGIVLTNARASNADKSWVKENPEKHYLLDQNNALYPERVIQQLRSNIQW